MGLDRAGQIALAHGDILHLLGADAHDHIPLEGAFVGQALVAAVQLDASGLHHALQEFNLAHKVRHEGVDRGGVDFPGRADLLNDAAVNDHNAVAHGHGLRLVMGHIHHGDAVLPLDFLDFKAHAFPQLGVQVGQGLVQQQQGGLCHQGAGQGHALLLAAGQLAGNALGVLNQVHGLQHTFDLLPDGGLIHFFDGQGIGHIVEHGHVGPHSVGLKHHADVALFRLEKHLAAGHHLVIEQHAAGGGLLKACDNAQHGGLAAARGPQQGNKFAIGKGCVESVQHDRIAKAFGDILDGYTCHNAFSLL